MNYQQPIKMNGENCYTLSHDNEAPMLVDNRGITIVYLSGNKTRIPRELVETAMRRLRQRGSLTSKDVHEGITRGNGPRADSPWPSSASCPASPSIAIRALYTMETQ